MVYVSTIKIWMVWSLPTLTSTVYSKPGWKALKKGRIHWPSMRAPAAPWRKTRFLWRRHAAGRWWPLAVCGAATGAMEGWWTSEIGDFLEPEICVHMFRKFHRGEISMLFLLTIIITKSLIINVFKLMILDANLPVWWLGTNQVCCARIVFGMGRWEGPHENRVEWRFKTNVISRHHITPLLETHHWITVSGA